ncbi:hypothetical protein ABT117_16715 [Streptomyces sp. NPDC002262]|uniref:hypothetical protein n=1 Tax=Streptomyces sp. NPDC002262 TaxID=3154414 RepID=UPI0033280FE3
MSLEDRGGDGDAGDTDLLAQGVSTIEDAVVGAGVAGEGGHVDGVAGLAQGEARDELAGEFDLVGRAAGVGEGESEGALGLGGGAFAGATVLFGLGVGGLVRGGGAGHVAVGPPDAAVDTVVTSGSAEGGDDGVGGGEVADEAGEVRKSAAAGDAAPSVDDALHASARFGGAAEAPLRLGEVVDGHLLQVAGAPSRAWSRLNCCYKLPIAPPKASDHRSFSGTSTTQAEALPPDVPAAVLKAAITPAPPRAEDEDQRDHQDGQDHDVPGGDGGPRDQHLQRAPGVPVDVIASSDRQR